MSVQLCGMDDSIQAIETDRSLCLKSSDDKSLDGWQAWWETAPRELKRMKERDQILAICLWKKF
jgi:hypothetical protein